MHGVPSCSRITDSATDLPTPDRFISHDLIQLRATNKRPKFDSVLLANGFPESKCSIAIEKLPFRKYTHLRSSESSSAREIVARQWEYKHFQKFFSPFAQSRTFYLLHTAKEFYNSHGNCRQNWERRSMSYWNFHLHGKFCQVLYIFSNKRN